eukprot:12434303-Ditylum_brightwellii.AAC.1
MRLHHQQVYIYRMLLKDQIWTSAMFLIPPETILSAPMVEPPPSSPSKVKSCKVSSCVLLDGWSNDILAVDHMTEAEKQYIDFVLGTIKENNKNEKSVGTDKVPSLSTYGK